MSRRGEGRRDVARVSVWLLSDLRDRVIKILQALSTFLTSVLLFLLFSHLFPDLTPFSPTVHSSFYISFFLLGSSSLPALFLIASHSQSLSLSADQ